MLGDPQLCGPDAGSTDRRRQDCDRWVADMQWMYTVLRNEGADYLCNGRLECPHQQMRHDVVLLRNRFLALGEFAHSPPSFTLSPHRLISSFALRMILAFPLYICLRCTWHLLTLTPAPAIVLFHSSPTVCQLHTLSIISSFTSRTLSAALNL